MNAIAFRYEGYSFIGLTIALIFSIWDVCVRLSRSEKIASLIGVQIAADGSDALRVVLFRIVLFFVVLHDWRGLTYTGTLAGILCASTIFSNGSSVGDLREQSFEADADAYAVYNILPNFIGGSYAASGGSFSEALFLVREPSRRGYLFLFRGRRQAPFC